MIDEINELRSLIEQDRAPRGVSAETVEAIDHVRKVGNIGAHMEKDINVIVDVDPKEAQLLIELIEMLFAEWYVARKEREARLASISELAAVKDIERGRGKPRSPAQKAEETEISDRTE